MAQPAYHPCMKLGAIQLAVALFGVSASLLFMPAASAQRGGGRGGGMSTRGSAMGARGMAIGRPAPALRGGYAARPAFYSGRGNGVRIARRGTYGTHYPIVLGYPYGYGYGLGWGDSGLDNGVYDPGYGDANNAYPDVLTPTGASSPDPGVAPYAPPQRAQLRSDPHDALRHRRAPPRHPGRRSRSGRHAEGESGCGRPLPASHTQLIDLESLG
jgi:hypothetical protein